MAALRVLTYHRIADPESEPMLHPRLVSATPAVFERHLDHIARRYTVVSMAEVVAGFRDGGRLPRRALLLTFDDAYRDFLTVAWPLLQQRSLPATMFVPTAYPGASQSVFWWDRLHRCFASTRLPVLQHPDLGALPLATTDARRRSLALVQAWLKTLPHAHAMHRVDEMAAILSEPPFTERVVLSWDELRQLAGTGLTVAPHSRTHPLLPRLSAAEQQAEIVDSIADVRREIGTTLPVFCYPSGAYDDSTVAAAGAAGIELAFTQDDGQNDPARADRLRLCRTNITRRTTATVLSLRLQPWFTHVDRWRHRQSTAMAPPPGMATRATS